MQAENDCNKAESRKEKMATVNCKQNLDEEEDPKSVALAIFYK